MSPPERPYTLWRRQTALDAPFTVSTIFTPSYRAKAERLAASLDSYGLPYALFEVPSIHRSISRTGSDDISYCKPRFLQWALPQFGRPLLFVDADCEICARPQLLWELERNETDFAIYNWFADASNDAWVPVPDLIDMKTEAGAPRFWQYGVAIDIVSADQLLCSGCVQYWANSSTALRLLATWERDIGTLKTAPDDEVLDYSFNISLTDKAGLRYFWLPRDYARYGWWIHTRPIINHPEVPSTFAQKGHFDEIGVQRFDIARLQKTRKAPPFPRDAVIDVQRQLILMKDPDSGELKPAAPASGLLHI